MSYNLKKGFKFENKKKEIYYSISNGQLFSFVGGYPLYKEECENLEELIVKMEEKDDLKNLSLGEISQDDFNFIIERIGNRIINLSINCIYDESFLDLKLLKKCKKLKKVSLNFSNKKIKLWNTRFNHKLEELEITGVKEIFHQKGLIGLKAKKLIIKRYSHGVSNVNELTIKDFSVFETMPNLEELVLSLKNKKDKEHDLISLSRLSNLKLIYLPKNYFFFNQYAWLTSKLPNVRGLGCYKIEYDHANEMDGYIINGSRMCWYVKGFEKGKLNKYIKKFDLLVDKYKNQDYPPSK